MAENQEVSETDREMEKLSKKEKEEEKKIPVFTVLKNNSILKNIFLIDTPPPPGPSSSSSSPNLVENNQELEEILVVGRHPDCNITLEHPSISRFHLRIHALPSKLSLSVFDLSSVHGTWVCGKKIAPGVRVELRDGDFLKIGGSSRIYRLHWIPLSRAYDYDNPFLPTIEESDPVEEKEETHEDDGGLSLQHDGQSQMEADDSLFADMNIVSQIKKLTPSSPPMPEDMNSPFSYDEEEAENQHPLHQTKTTTNLQLPPRQLDEADGIFLQHDQSQSNFDDLVDGLDSLFADMNVISETTQFASLAHLVREDGESPFSCEENKNVISQVIQSIPSLTHMPESMNSAFCYKEEAENKHPFHHSKSTNLQPPPSWQKDEDGISPQHDRSRTEFDNLDGLDSLLTNTNVISETTAFTSLAPLVHEDRISPFSCKVEAENQNYGLQPVWQFDRENSIPDAALASGKSQHESPENSPLRPQLNSGTSIWTRRGKSASVSVQTSRGRERSNTTHLDFEVKLENHENLSTESVPEDPFASEDKVNEVFTPDKENCIPDSRLSSFKKIGKKHELGNLVSSESVPEDLFASEEKGKEVFTPDKENCTPHSLLRSFKKFGQEKRKHGLSANSLNSFTCEDDEEAFTPDKENITLNTLLLRSLKRLEKLDVIKHSKPYRSSPLKNTGSGIRQELDNVKGVLQEKKPTRSSASRTRERLEVVANVLKKGQAANRVPFQSLLVSPNDKNPQTSRFEAALRSCCNPTSNLQKGDSIHYLHTSPKEENKKWTMVVDAASLLNKESRKALQLMQGLQGTSLIIPRIVIRELDCMKRRGNLFRRTADVCSALDWIEDCMVNARSWIHVQSAIEDVRPIAPTPPASPLSLFSQEIDTIEKFSISSIPFSPCGSRMDIVSPTTEDHILECALFFRRTRNTGQLVLLSNDVTLKIKAMAEGLLCETAEEFRQSLVNPFSERFLWTDSSPRGPTWSCVDDVVLREKYYNGCPIQKQSRSGEGAKGLKLILLHNSHFRHITSVR